MKYMLLTYLDEKKWLAMTAEDQKKAMDECAPMVKELLATRKFLGGAPLHPTSTATTVSYGGGKHLVTDGPFAETREQLGGYTLIDVANLDEALAIAKGFIGTSDLPRIEVRPVVEIDLPTH